MYPGVGFPSITILLPYFCPNSPSLCPFVDRPLPYLSILITSTAALSGAGEESQLGQGWLAGPNHKNKERQVKKKWVAAALIVAFGCASVANAEEHDYFSEVESKERQGMGFDRHVLIHFCREEKS